MAQQPSGTVTFLFTDIEGSTRLVAKLGVDRYAQALDDHRRLLRAAFERHHGYEVDYEGDAFIVAFQSASEALAAAGEAQSALSAHAWPEGCELRVRMGLHTGEPLWPRRSTSGSTCTRLHGSWLPDMAVRCSSRRATRQRSTGTSL